jgi:hypothetical protein
MDGPVYAGRSSYRGLGIHLRMDCVCEQHAADHRDRR